MASDDIWRELGHFIAKRRQQRGMETQPELAEAAGVSLSTIARLESGRPMTRRSKSWPLIEKALQLEPGYIERYTAGYSRKSGFLIEASNISDIEPQVRSLVKDALMEALPDVTVSRVLTAEQLIIESLQKGGFIPSRN